MASMKPMTAKQGVVVSHRYLDLLKTYFDELQSHPVEGWRRRLVLASILKVQSAANAAIHLADIVAVEEIWAINRTLSEMVINTAYFQVAPELELERFINFDFTHIPKQTARLRKSLPKGTLRLSGLEKQVAKMASDAKLATGLGDRDISWSRRSSIDRADFTDKAMKQDGLLKRMVLTGNPYGHAAVHATYFCYGWFLNGIEREHDVPDEARMIALGVALHGVTLSLQTLCCALEALFALGMMAEVERAGIPPSEDAELPELISTTEQ